MLETKTKRSTDLAVIPAKTRKARLEVLEANFGSNSGKIIEMLESHDSDGAITLLKKKLLQTTIDLLPLAETMIRDSGSSKGVYQFATLVSQCRELMADIQADYDKGALARSIEDAVIRPAFQDMAQDILTEHHSFRKIVEDKLKPQHTSDFNTELKELANTLARRMQVHFLSIRDGLVRSLKG